MLWYFTILILFYAAICLLMRFSCHWVEHGHRLHGAFPVRTARRGSTRCSELLWTDLHCSALYCWGSDVSVDFKKSKPKFFFIRKVCGGMDELFAL